jgi:broad specificity phosphatase PhoE
MRIVFVRHGESEANVHKIISNTGFTHGLTEKGINQARDIALKLKREYPNPVKIITSPLKRAVETSQEISKQLNIEYHVDNRLIEFHTGELEGKKDPESWNRLYKLWKSWSSGNDYSIAIPGGEALNEVAARLNNFLESLINEYSENDVIHCVCHGGILLTALPVVIIDSKTEKLKSYDLQNTDIVEIEYSEDIGFRCIKYGPI